MITTFSDMNSIPAHTPDITCIRKKTSEMRYRIAVTRDGSQLHFYLMCNKEPTYLFSTKYSDEVYQYFKNGRSDSEIRKFHQWGKDICRDRIVEKCKSHIYVHYRYDETAA